MREQHVAPARPQIAYSYRDSGGARTRQRGARAPRTRGRAADLQLFGYKPWHLGEPVRVHER